MLRNKITNLPLFRPEPVAIPDRPDPRFFDLTGLSFSHLKVLYFAGKAAKSGMSIWFCECSCGGTTVARTDRLRFGQTISCGCVRRKRTKPARTYSIDESIKEQTCIKCGITKPVSEYHPNKAKKTGLVSSCKTCRAEYCVRYRAENLQHVKKRDTKARRIRRKDPVFRESERLKSRYGITKEVYDDMLDSQGGVCKICGCLPERILHKRLNRNISRTTFGVDHDHATGKIRGIICQNCNIGLGGFRDNPESMAKAIAYLQQAAKEA